MNCPFCDKKLVIDDDYLWYHEFESTSNHHFYSIIKEDIVVEEFYADELRRLELTLIHNNNYYELCRASAFVGNEELIVSGSIDGKSIVEIYNRLITLKVFL